MSDVFFMLFIPSKSNHSVQLEANVQVAKCEKVGDRL